MNEQTKQPTYPAESPDGWKKVFAAAEKADTSKVQASLEAMDLPRRLIPLKIAEVAEDAELAAVEKAGEGQAEKLRELQQELGFLIVAKPETVEKAREVAKKSQQLRDACVTAQRAIDAAERARSQRRWLHLWDAPLFGEQEPPHAGHLSMLPMAPKTADAAIALGITGFYCVSAGLLAEDRRGRRGNQEAALHFILAACPHHTRKVEKMIPNVILRRDWIARENEQVIRRRADDVLAVTHSETLQAGRPLTPAEWFAVGLRTCGLDVPSGGPLDVVRAGLSGASVAVAFANQINLVFHDGYSAVPDTLAGVTTEQEIRDFMPATANLAMAKRPLGTKRQARSGAVLLRTPGAAVGVVALHDAVCDLGYRHCPGQTN